MVTDLLIVRDGVEVRLLQGQLVTQSADQHKNKCSDNVYLPALLGNYYRPAAAERERERESLLIEPTCCLQMKIKLN